MKHFIFRKDSTKTGRHGGRTLTFNTYQIIDNELVYCGEFKESSAAYKGDMSAVMNYLARAGKIDSQFAEGYFQFGNPDFRLTEI